ncbi:MAG TPA: hypothetical protein VMD27_01930 [Candidatus Aquilonibacter sp.]|nr:hypothetical protein [Candidatus Aquilonibacter sp.]
MEKTFARRRAADILREIDRLTNDETAHVTLPKTKKQIAVVL